jgi:hypothetical protein
MNKLSNEKCAQILSVLCDNYGGITFAWSWTRAEVKQNG